MSDKTTVQAVAVGPARPIPMERKRCMRIAPAVAARCLKRHGIRLNSARVATANFG